MDKENIKRIKNGIKQSRIKLEKLSKENVEIIENGINQNGMILEKLVEENAKRIENEIKQNGMIIEKLVNLIEDVANSGTFCVGGCGNDDVFLYYCSHCNKSHPTCKFHFENRTKTQECLVCGCKGITRRWTMPVHK